jgi:phosphonate transport system permease protein
MESRRLLTIILVGAFAWSLLNVDWRDGALHPGGLSALGEIASALVRPELSVDVLGVAVRSAWRTVAYAVTGLSVALVIGLPLGLVGSGVLFSSATDREASRGGQTVVAVVRLVLAFFRSVHELVWAWLFVAAIGLSPMAAVFALAIPYGGILGRVYAELFQDVPEAPLQALRRAGASEWRVFWYGRLPIVLSDILSYTFYRLECGIRSATVLSFVGLGGLGFQIQIALDDLDYQRAWTFVLALVALIVLVEAWSSAVRKRVSV